MNDELSALVIVAIWFGTDFIEACWRRYCEHKENLARIEKGITD